MRFLIEKSRFGIEKKQTCTQMNEIVVGESWRNCCNREKRLEELLGLYTLHKIVKSEAEE